MRLTWIAAAAAAATGMAVPAIAGGEWPDGPNKLWFEGLQRPDNHLNPSRKIDQKSLFCCGIADTVKTKFKVEPGGRTLPRRSLVCLAKRRLGPGTVGKDCSRLCA